MRLCTTIQFPHMHVADEHNTAADILSRIKLNLKERTELKLREDITIQIQVNIRSAIVANEEQFFLQNGTS